MITDISGGTDLNRSMIMFNGLAKALIAKLRPFGKKGIMHRHSVAVAAIVLWFADRRGVGECLGDGGKQERLGTSALQSGGFRS
jgi:hypothetical protein